MAPVVAVAVAGLVFGALGPIGVVEPFNPNFVVLSLLVALLALWLFAAGDPWGLPLFVGSASLAAQAHVATLPVVGVLVLVAVGVGVVDVRRQPPDAARRGVLLRRALPVAVLVGSFCWSGPLYDQLAGTGNLWALFVGGNGATTAGWRFGVERFIGAVGPQAQWFDAPRAGAVPPAPPGLDIVGAAVVLGVLVVLTGRAVAARRRFTAAGGLVALAGAASVALVGARLPVTSVSLKAPANRMFLWPVGAVVWIVVAVAIFDLVWERLEAPVTRWRDRSAGGRAGVLVPVVVAAVALLLVVPDAERSVRASDSWRFYGAAMYGPTRVHTAAIEDAVAPGATIRLVTADDSVPNRALLQVLVPQLRLAGHPVQIVTEDIRSYWASYLEAHPGHGPADVAILLRGSANRPPAPAGATRLSVYDPAQVRPPDRGRHRSVVRMTGDEVSSVYLLPQVPSDGVDNGR